MRNRAFSVLLATVAASSGAACAAPQALPPPTRPLLRAIADTPAPPAPAPTEAPPASGLEGTWRGTLGGSERGLHLALSLRLRGPGNYEGILESLDQGTTLAVEKLSVTDGRVRFEVPSAGGSYDGTLDPAWLVMTGTWTQKGGQPLVFTRGKPESQAASTARRRPLDVPCDVVVPMAPTVFRADDKNHVVYEAHVTNLSSRAIELRSLDVVDGETKANLTHSEGIDLVTQIERPGMPTLAGFERLALGPGLRAVVFVWLDLSGQAPTSLEHRIAISFADGTEQSLRTSPVRIGKEPMAVFGGPLRGGDWMAANGPSNVSAHRRAFLPVGGRAVTAQRFAIDWVRVKDATTSSGDPSKNSSYYAYGAEALSVADGVITGLRDGIPDNTPADGSRAVPITIDTIAGNHVIVDLGRARYALYAHLQPGSLRVKVGDRVRRGQVLGLVGNSGNSAEPHLHFHVTDANSPLGAEGIPYGFESFEVRGPTESSFKKMTRQLPTQNEIIRFPSGP